jgi:hypothetical protein
MITYLGDMTVGALIPYTITVQAAVGGATAFLAQALASARLAAEFKIPDASKILKVKANAAAVLDMSVNIPKITANITTSANVKIALIAGLIAQLKALISGPTATAGVSAFVYNGPLSLMGSEIQTATGAGLPNGTVPYSTANALVIVTTSSLTWSAISFFLRTK